MIFLGCDGGSTKTEFILSDESGEILSHKIFPGCNYGYIRYAGFKKLFTAALNEIYAESCIPQDEITFAVFGLPSYGEVEETEINIPEILAELIPPEKTRIVNDSVVGWGGSLSARPGINVVSGTGSIAYGVDQKGNDMRVGGWSLVFCDEGSGSWIGRQVIRTFTMQSDGRLPRTQLYYLVKERYALFTKDLYFTDRLLEFQNTSSKLAEIQMIALAAYQSGDTSVIPFYEEAANHLVNDAVAIRSHLDFDKDQPVKVSYSGGLFRGGDIITKPFLTKLKNNGFLPVQPKYPPSIGSIALAASHYLEENTLDLMLKNAYQTLVKS